MKHKAQESLDIVECNLSTGSELCGIRLMTGRCKDCNTKENLKTLQNLIDCQLTVEEIEYIQLLLSLEVYIKKCGNTAFDKLEKQKGMWKNDVGKK